MSSPRAGTTHSCCFNPSSHRVKKWRIDWETQMMRRSYRTACQQHWNCIFYPIIWGRRQEKRTCPRSFYSLLTCSVQFSSVTQSCPTLCNPMNCSTQGLPVHHQLSEFTQTQVHWVGDAIQPSHPLSSPSPPALNLSQHQGLFKWVSSSHQVAKVLEFQLQHQSFQWIHRTDLL